MSRPGLLLLTCLLLVPLVPAGGFIAPVSAQGAVALTPDAVATPTILVPDVEFIDLAPVGDRFDQAEDAARAKMLSEHIRASVAASKRYRIVDRGEQDHKPPHTYSNCTACFMDWAKKQGAGFVLVTSVQKESRLILAVNMTLVDLAHPEKAGNGGSVELRGDTDETWLAGARLMLDHAVGAPLSP